MLTCHKCKICKIEDDFHNDSRRKNGKYPKCKQCCKTYQENYRKNNAVALRKNNREYYAKNVNKICAYQAAYLASNKAKVYARNRRKSSEYIDVLSDGYVANTLRIHRRDVPNELLELKRAQLEIYRLTKQLNKEIQNVTE